MSFYIHPDSEHFFKSGLAKSAFNRSIYSDYPLDFFLPGISETQKLSMALTSRRAIPKFYQAHDAYMMYYRPYESVLASLKKQNKAAPIWRAVVEKVARSEKFYDINKVTANSTELSILAATRFLLTLLRKIDVEEYQRQFKHFFQQQQQQQQQLTLTGQQIQQQITDFLNKATEEAVEEAYTAVSEYRENAELADEAISTLTGSGGQGFSKDALSVFRFLQNPDNFRKRVNILHWARIMLANFLTAVPTSLIHQQITSIYGGISGVTRMVSEKQLTDILPSELALTQLGGVGRALLSLKIVQRQLMVYQHSVSVKPVIFVDKSGSMASDIMFNKWGKVVHENLVPKISIASGLALALYKRLDADVYLFDTELEKVNPSKVAQILLTIEADGGTDIDPVLDEIVKIGKKEYIYIIISDGITDADSDVLEKFRCSGLVSRVKLILVPPSGTRYNWVELLIKHRNVFYAEDVADFSKTIKSALSFQ